MADARLSVEMINPNWTKWDPRTDHTRSWGHLAIMGRMQIYAFIGIDYSGAETPTRRLKGLQVYEAAPGRDPTIVTSPSALDSKHWN